MNLYRGALLLLLLAPFQGVLANWLAPITDLHPNLVMLAVVGIGINSSPRGGAAWGAFAGLLLDLVSAGPLGVCALSLALVGFLCGLVQAMPVFVPQLIPPVAAAVGAVVFDLSSMLLLHLAGCDFNWLAIIYEVILPSALLNLLTMPLMHWLLVRLRGKTRPRPEFGW